MTAELGQRRAVKLRKSLRGDGHVCLVLLISCALVLVSGIATDRCCAARAPASPDHLRVAALLRLCQYTTWPDSSFPKKGEPFVVGFLDDGPLGPGGVKLLEEQQVKQRDVEVRVFQNEAEGAECHLLYIHSTNAKRVQAALQAVKGKDVLTVGRFVDFCAQDYGGLVRWREYGPRTGSRRLECEFNLHGRVKIPRQVVELLKTGIVLSS